MRIETIEQARELVGRTFERDGKRRIVVRVDNLSEGRPGWFMSGDVYWKRPLGKTRSHPVILFDFKEWLSKATEVPATSSNE